MKFFYAAALLLLPAMTVAAPAAEEVKPTLVKRQMYPCLFQNAWAAGMTGATGWGMNSAKGFAATGFNKANCVQVAADYDVTTVGQLYTKGVLGPNTWAASVPATEIGAQCGICIAPLDKNNVDTGVRLLIVNVPAPVLGAAKEVPSNAIAAMGGASNAKGCWKPVPLIECLNIGCPIGSPVPRLL
ncbi:hypothetical protein Dda_1908 [Drechslerella dactyloides]|uniref:Uncharacterized protein n=1 Tax=Drechslerella dactyloides TaxID=74499 RepID=A0AAD6J2W8_DREDA|nr:hypothetical protein Dda_1908 [Drechslerella dactyloides]